jgi:ABC-type antimicrobial peptide transport system permease subunit
MEYFHNKPLGFDKEAVLTVPLAGTRDLNLETMRSALTSHPGIAKVSFSNLSVSSEGRQRTPFNYAKNGAVEEFITDVKFGDEQYLDTYKLKLLAGRNYLQSDSIKEFVVNEALIKQLGIKTPEEAIGQTISLYGQIDAPIVGVVEDFHVTSLHEGIGACILAANRRSYRTINIKLNVAQMKEALVHVEKVWTRQYPENVFSYRFIDQTIASFYEEEQKTASLFKIFAGIAIFIGCLGLFGLISFITTQKTKEVGIRKVLGASAANITLLFFKEFALLVIVAFLIAAPVAYYLMSNWLQNFQYSIPLGAGIFVAAIAASLLIAALTVSYQSIKAALANPIKSLRNE